MRPAHELMTQDGAPAALFIPQDQRNAAWANRPMTVMPSFVPRRDDSPEAQAMRAQIKADEKTALLNRLARSRARKETKAIDYSRMRWDGRRGKFVEDVVPTQVVMRDATKMYSHNADLKVEFQRVGAKTPWMAPAPDDWSRVTKDTARTLAQLNGVWDDKYAKLSGGLLVMTITNRLKGIVKKGGEIKWQ